MFGTICVVNIQKLMEESKMPHVENDYNVKTQRIFFVDEAHRIYDRRQLGEEVYLKVELSKM